MLGYIVVIIGSMWRLSFNRGQADEELYKLKIEVVHPKLHWQKIFAIFYASFSR